MKDDLITSLRALAAGRHDDVSVAVDAVIEIERLTRDEARAEVERLRKEMREIAEDCESEYPQSYKKIARGIREALGAKP